MKNHRVIYYCKTVSQAKSFALRVKSHIELWIVVKDEIKDELNNEKLINSSNKKILIIAEDAFISSVYCAELKKEKAEGSEIITYAFTDLIFSSELKIFFLMASTSITASTTSLHEERSSIF